MNHSTRKLKRAYITDDELNKIYNEVSIIYIITNKNAIDDKQLCDHQIITHLINNDGFRKIVKDGNPTLHSL
jgi:hypothetical protein